MSLSQFSFATSTQLILAGSVSVTSYLQTIVFFFTCRSDVIPTDNGFYACRCGVISTVSQLYACRGDVVQACHAPPA